MKILYIVNNWWLYCTCTYASHMNYLKFIKMLCFCCSKYDKRIYFFERQYSGLSVNGSERDGNSVISI